MAYRPVSPATMPGQAALVVSKLSAAELAMVDVVAVAWLKASTELAAGPPSDVRNPSSPDSSTPKP